MVAKTNITRRRQHCGNVNCTKAKIALLETTKLNTIYAILPVTQMQNTHMHFATVHDAEMRGK